MARLGRAGSHPGWKTAPPFLVPGERAACTVSNWSTNENDVDISVKAIIRCAHKRWRRSLKRSNTENNRAYWRVLPAGVFEDVETGVAVACQHVLIPTAVPHLDTGASESKSSERAPQAGRPRRVASP